MKRIETLLKSQPFSRLHLVAGVIARRRSIEKPWPCAPGVPKNEMVRAQGFVASSKCHGSAYRRRRPHARGTDRPPMASVVLNCHHGKLRAGENAHGDGVARALAGQR